MSTTRQEITEAFESVRRATPGMSKAEISFYQRLLEAAVNSVSGDSVPSSDIVCLCLDCEKARRKETVT